MMKRTLAILPLLALTAAAQDNNAAQIKLQLRQAIGDPPIMMGVKGAVMGPTVKGAPYSAIETIENTQTLADGTRINQTTQTMVYRDSEGRMRRETPDLITIFDPVANASYSLNPKTQTAMRLPLGLGVAGQLVSEQRGANGQTTRFVYRSAGVATAGAAPMLPPMTPLPELAGNGSIGVMYSPSDSEQARAALKANSVTDGVFVQNVVPGSPAEKAGIQAGDVIVGINGKTVRDGSELAAAMSGLRAGATVSVSAVRDGRTQIFQAAVADRSQVFPNVPPAGAPAGDMFFLSAGAMPGLSTIQVRLTPKSESLGQQLIEGVNAEGTRTTATIEAGQIGNDRPIQIVDERWYSRELEIAVKMTHSDPRTGQENLQLSKINRVEPSPDLFQVPAGYQVLGK
jgi:membrane-associated protease RseP (regulator of RpoE activity)